MRLLLVEDHEPLACAVDEQLLADGHAVDRARTIAEAESSLAVVDYALVLLDLLLPDGKGLDLLRRLRRSGDDTPVIVLTALDQISDRIAGLNAGADDYLVKPFDLDELSARVGAVGRRYSGSPNPILSIGELEVDLAARSVLRAGRRVDLTKREWALFETMIKRSGTTIPKGRLEECLYAFGREIESNTVEAHISRLRKKIGQDAIATVRGIGYRLVRPAPP